MRDHRRKAALLGERLVVVDAVEVARGAGVLHQLRRRDRRLLQRRQRRAHPHLLEADAGLTSSGGRRARAIVDRVPFGDAHRRTRMVARAVKTRALESSTAVVSRTMTSMMPAL